MSVLVFGVIGLALAASVAGQAGSGGECTIAGSTEFYYLVQQWGAGYCATTSCAVTPPSDHFTIHGLWPNYCQITNGATYPQNCAGAAYDESTFSDLIPQMQTNWPSFSSNGNSYFWSHEWTKHGTCAVAYLPSDSLVTQHDYFGLALQLRTASSLYSNLASQGVTPSATAYSTTTVRTAIQRTLGVNPYLSCSGSVLTEIWLCYNQNQQLVTCGDSGTCGSTLVYTRPAGSSPSSPPPVTASPSPPPPVTPTASPPPATPTASPSPPPTSPSPPPTSAASPPPASIASPPPQSPSPPPPVTVASPPPATPAPPPPPAPLPPTCVQSGSTYSCPAGLACRFKTTTNDTTGHCCRVDQKYETIGKCQCDYGSSDPCTCPAGTTLGNTGQNTPATKTTDGHCV